MYVELVPEVAKTIFTGDLYLSVRRLRPVLTCSSSSEIFCSTATLLLQTRLRPLLRPRPLLRTQPRGWGHGTREHGDTGGHGHRHGYGHALRAAAAAAAANSSRHLKPLTQAAASSPCLKPPPQAPASVPRIKPPPQAAASSRLKPPPQTPLAATAPGAAPIVFVPAPVGCSPHRLLW